MALRRFVRFDGSEWEWEEKLTIPEARDIKATTGLLPGAWQDAVENFDPDAISALVVMLRKRSGDAKARIGDVTGDMLSFSLILKDETGREVVPRTGKDDEGKPTVELVYADNGEPYKGAEGADPTPAAAPAEPAE